MRLPATKIVLLFLGLSLGLASCAPNVPIAAVKDQPVEQSVQVNGKVITIAPMVKQTAYELQDDQGNTVWILTNKNSPKIGEQVSVSGKVKFESIAIEGEELAEKYLEDS